MLIRIACDTHFHEIVPRSATASLSGILHTFRRSLPPSRKCRNCIFIREAGHNAQRTFHDVLTNVVCSIFLVAFNTLIKQCENSRFSLLEFTRDRKGERKKHVYFSSKRDFFLLSSYTYIKNQRCNIFLVK